MLRQRPNLAPGGVLFTKLVTKYPREPWHQPVRIIIIILKSIIALHNLHNISPSPPSPSQLSIIDHSKACQCQGRLQDFAHESWQAQHLLHGSKDQVLPQDWVGWISNCPVMSSNYKQHRQVADSRSWVAASQMWRAGIEVQDAEQGRDCQNGRWWRQGGQGEGDGWFLERVCECEIISQAYWHFFAGAFKCWWAPTVPEWECMCLTCALWSMLVWRWLKFSLRNAPCTHKSFRTSKELVEGAPDIWAGWQRREVASSWRSDVLARPERSFDLDFY